MVSALGGLSFPLDPRGLKDESHSLHLHVRLSAAAAVPERLHAAMCQLKEPPSGPLHWELPQRPRDGAIGKHCKREASLERGSDVGGGGLQPQIPPQAEG